MFPKGQHPIYPYTNSGRQEVLGSLGINESRMEECVNIITDWFRKQPHLTDAFINPRIIEAYIGSTKGSVEEAKRRIDAFYRNRRNAPEIIEDRIKILNDTERSMCDNVIFAPAAKPFKGMRVNVVKFIDLDNHYMDDVIQKIFMLIDVRLSNDFVAGDIWITDFQNMTMAHFLKYNLMTAHKFAKMWQEGMRFKLCAYHILNSNVGNFAKSASKPFISQKLYDRIIVHEKLEDLYKYVPKEYLPKDYGGYGPSLEEYKEKMDKFIASQDTKEFLIKACNMVSDESKRPKPEYDEDYLPGTFKKLDID